MMTIIPRLSYKKIIEGDNNALNDLEEALNQTGFFTIYEHGLNKDVVKKSYEVSKDFFNLPLYKKEAYSIRSNGGARGYTPFAKETALGEDTPDLKEFWHHGPIISKLFDSRVPSNINVDELNNFNKNLDLLFNELNTLGTSMLSSIAKILGLNESYFNDWVAKGNSLLRLIHYPPNKGVNMLRAREHADINLITLLIGADEPGLEVKDKNNNWIPIKAKSNDIVCNIGDMLQLVTDGKLKSTNHRVVKYNSDETKSRYSIPFFLHPSPNILLKSIYNDNDKGVLAHNFLEERIRAINLY